MYTYNETACLPGAFAFFFSKNLCETAEINPRLDHHTNCRMTQAVATAIFGAELILYSSSLSEKEFAVDA